jgi:hypothetical protein
MRSHGVGCSMQRGETKATPGRDSICAFGSNASSAIPKVAIGGWRHKTLSSVFD